MDHALNGLTHVGKGKAGADMQRLSSFPLPDEAYLPGLTARVDPAMPELPSEFDFEREWSAIERYRFGIDCLNHDLGWECHEALEAIWHRVGRKTTRSGLGLQTLILLGCARVKAISGKDSSVLIHRALERMQGLEGRVLYGLDWREVKEEIHQLRDRPSHRVFLNFYD